MSHILITGGTGMLSGAVIKFLSKYETVSVIARHQSSFKKISAASDFPHRLNPIILDYSDTDLLTEKINSAIISKGQIKTAVCWIHSFAENSNNIIGEILNTKEICSDYFHILGSAYYDPENISRDIEAAFSKFRYVNYKKIILGFKIENGNSRWLTDEEISDGVVEAVDAGLDEYRIGITQPWESKP
ncbi:MAG TPA: hypothetical protein PK536_00315 [Ignavibacteria bacterium]|nr:hypothetical protein [Bacteroidota bacterium]HRI83867.1 hypothetical protein [Ignavibacteria bacterium]HRJ99886.1 hypothetical protein [Ignavibacteria bacterium]